MKRMLRMYLGEYIIETMVEHDLTPGELDALAHDLYWKLHPYPRHEWAHTIQNAEVMLQASHMDGEHTAYGQLIRKFTSDGDAVQPLRDVHTPGWDPVERKVK